MGKRIQSNRLELRSFDYGINARTGTFCNSLITQNVLEIKLLILFHDSEKKRKLVSGVNNANLGEM